MNTYLIKIILAENPQYNMCKIVDATNISKTTIFNHLIRICQSMKSLKKITQFTEISFMNYVFICDFSPKIWKRFVIADETWIFKIKMCIENTLDLRTIDFQLSWSMDFIRGKFFWRESPFGKMYVIYYKFLSQKKTINSTKYCNQFNKLKVAIVEKRPELANQGVIFHHDKIVCCIGCKKKAVAIWLGHSNASSVLPKSYFIRLLFVSIILKNFLHDKRFQSVSEIKTHLEKYFVNKSQQFWKGKIIKINIIINILRDGKKW